MHVFVVFCIPTSTIVHEIGLREQPKLVEQVPCFAYDKKYLSQVRINIFLKGQRTAYTVAYFQNI